jgi:signal peptidase I
VPGDTVELRDDRLFLNGVEAQYDEPAATTSEPMGSESTPALRAIECLAGTEHAVQVLPHMPAMRNFGPADVPPDTYF